MAKVAEEGDVFKIDLGNGKPPHYHIILFAPRIDGTFLVVSFTDCHNLPEVADVWPYKHVVCPQFSLTKPSVIALRYALVKDQEWLIGKDAEYIGVANQETLERARCNVHWYKHLLPGRLSSYAAWYGREWTLPCGPCPQHPSKIA